MTDKGYDSQANRAAALARGINPVIPRRENSKQRGRFFPKRLYKLRARIEQTIGKLKRFKRVAMRCEKTDISYSAIISFACGLMLVKSVHTTYSELPACGMHKPLLSFVSCSLEGCATGYTRRRGGRAPSAEWLLAWSAP
jgi:transposase